MSLRKLFVIALNAICLFGLLGCQSSLEDNSDASTLVYELTPILSETGNSLTIELSFIGDTDGETEIVLGQAWADEQTPWTRFKNISLTSEGQPLLFNRKTRKLTITHDANAPLKLTYHLHQNDGRKADGDSGFGLPP